MEGAPSTGIRWRAAVIVLAGILSYSNSLSGPPLFDDHASLLENQRIRTLQPSSVLFPERENPLAGRPLVNLSFAVNYAIGGLDVRGYHVWNLAVHLLCGLVAFGLVRRTLHQPRVADRVSHRSIDIALAAALLGVVHPLTTEAVDYLTQRTESMMALFYLLTMYTSARAIGAPRPILWQAAALADCALGLACKESMVTAPIMVVLYDRAFVFGSMGEAVRRRGRFYAVLATTWLILAALVSSGPRMFSAGFSTGVSPWTYLLNQCVMIPRYLRLVFWPRSLVLAYGYPRSVALVDVLAYA